MVSQVEFVESYFRLRAGEEISHSVSKPEIESGWLALTGVRIEDADRAIRTLADKGVLRKVRNGVYTYVAVDDRAPTGFTSFARNAILAAQAFKCHVSECQIRISDAELYVVQVISGDNWSSQNGRGYCLEHLVFHKLTFDLGQGASNLRIVLNELIKHVDCEDWISHARSMSETISSCRKPINGNNLI